MALIIISLVIFLLAFVYCKGIKKKNKGKEIRGPGVPILGDLPTATWWGIKNAKKLPMHRTLELHEKYGSIYKFNVGTATFAMVSDPQLAKKVLTHEHFQEHINLPFVKHFGAKKGLFVADTKRWKVHRRFSQALLKGLGFGSLRLQDNILEEADYLIDLLGRSEGRAMSTKYPLSKSVSNVINVLVFGKRYGYEDPEFEKYLDYARGITQISLTLVFLPMMIPFLAKRPEIMGRIPSSATFVKSYTGVRDFCFREVRQQKAKLRDENGNQTEAYNEKDTFITSFLKEQFKLEQEGNEDHLFTDEDLSDTISDMFVAGTDTTATTLSWGFLYLALHEDIQDKLYHEVESVGNQILEQKQHLHYTRAVMDEIIRMGAVIPMIMRQTMTPTMVEDYEMEADTIVAVNNFAMSRNPELFPEPERFNPDRFLSQSGEYAPNFPVETFLFGQGKRACLGASLAQMEYIIFLVKVIQVFKISLPEEEKCRVEEILIGEDGAAHIPKGHKLNFEKR